MHSQNKMPPDHATAAEAFLQDDERANWHDKALWFIREKRDVASKQIPDWELLRETASQIKLNVLGNLDNYLEQFERNAQANGIIVHWAADAAEHNRIVLSIIQEHGIQNWLKASRC
jgi:L-lactate dehydrogenase complex protein LldF